MNFGFSQYCNVENCCLYKRMYKSKLILGVPFIRKEMLFLLGRRMVILWIFREGWKN